MKPSQQFQMKWRNTLGLYWICSSLWCHSIGSHYGSARAQEHSLSSPSSSSLSRAFPSSELVQEFAMLSNVVYEIQGCDSDLLLPLSGKSHDITCHSYEQSEAKTQVMVVSSDKHKYIAVCYAGTDNMIDWMHDADIAMVPFGPNPDHPIFVDEKMQVHKGFNHAVFSYGLYDKLYDTVTSLLDQHPDYQIITTGHSLGAADSILTAVAMAHNLTSVDIQSFNFGCPRTGDLNWKHFVDNIPNVGVWRFVYENDIIPRLPGIRFQHVGHTVQFKKKHAYAYYLHDGDKSLHYAGVPSTWSTVPFVDPLSFPEHSILNYMDYIKKKSRKHPETFWAHDFVTTSIHQKLEDDLVNEIVNGARDFLSDLVEPVVM